MIGMDPEALETEAQSIEGLAAELGGRLDAFKEAVFALDWTGQAREAYVTMISEWRESIRSVEEGLAEGIGGGLRGIKEAFIQTDSGIAAGISGSA